ncbi:hypothetical protein [Paenibacillus gorillae]|nr:hypothetical protein [Paenibacillus gorillae]
MLEVVDVEVSLSLRLKNGMVHKNNEEATGTLTFYRSNTLCGMLVIIV